MIMLKNFIAILLAGLSFIIIKYLMVLISQFDIIIICSAFIRLELFLAYILNFLMNNINFKHFIRLCTISCMLVSWLYLYLTTHGDLFWVLLQIAIVHIFIIRFCCYKLRKKNIKSIT